MVRRQDKVIAAERDGRKSSEAEILRRIADMLSLWRLCGNAACRRAQACRGRPHRCARHSTALPEGVRAFLAAMLAAKLAGVAFDDFLDAMAEGDDAAALSAWTAAARAGVAKTGHLANVGDAPLRSPYISRRNQSSAAAVKRPRGSP
jgi:hypothetical protein